MDVQPIPDISDIANEFGPELKDRYVARVGRVLSVEEVSVEGASYAKYKAVIGAQRAVIKGGMAHVPQVEAIVIEDKSLHSPETAKHFQNLGEILKASQGKPVKIFGEALGKKPPYAVRIYRVEPM